MMSTYPTAAIDEEEHCLLDRAGRIGEQLARAATELAAACLIETERGSVVAHAFPTTQRPALLVDAVLSRTSRPLHAAADRRRTCAVTAAGAVESLRLGDQRAFVLPLALDGRLVGLLWVVPLEQRAPLDRVLEHTAAVGRLLADGSADTVDWAARAVAGKGPLPREFAGRPLHVAAVRRTTAGTMGVTDVLRLASRRRPPKHGRIAVTETDDGALVLLAGCGRVPHDLLTHWCHAAVGIDGSALRAAVAGPCHDVAGLPLLRRQAEQAVRVIEQDGTCLAVDAVRSVVVLDRLGPLLDGLPDLGRDPLRALQEHDSTRHTCLADSLLAWLDAHGDSGIAARSMRVHPNTLRYRLARAWDVLGVDAEDSAVRLELHLRLRRARAAAS